MACLQISSQLPVRLVHDRGDLVFVKIDILVSLHRPPPVFIDIFAAVVDLIHRLAPFFAVHIDRIGEWMPGEILDLPETGRKDIPPVVSVVLGHISPHLREEMLPSLRLLKDHGGFVCFAPGQRAERAVDLFVRVLLRIAQHQMVPVLLQILRVDQSQHLLFRRAIHYSIFQSPAAQDLAHGRIPDTAVEVAGLKFLHFAQALFRRGYADPVQQLVEIHIRQRGRDPMEFSFPDLCPPGKIAPQLVQIQIVIGRKVAPELAGPGSIVLIVLHELALPVEIPALILKRTAPVLIELHHLQDFRRDLPCRRARRQWPVGRAGLS